jgi:acyl carrier protein
MNNNSTATSQVQIEEWLVAYLSQLLEVDPAQIDLKMPLESYGLDSSAAVGLTGDLENFLGRELEPTILYDYTTIAALSQHLAS